MRYEGKTALLSRRELTIGFLTGAISSFFGIGRTGSQPAKPVTIESLRQSELIRVLSAGEVRLMYSTDGANWEEIHEIKDGGFLVPPDMGNWVYTALANKEVQDGR